MEEFTITYHYTVRVPKDFEIGESFTEDGVKYTKMKDGWRSSNDKQYIECEYDGCTEGDSHSGGVPQVKIFRPKKGQVFCSEQCESDWTEEEE